MPDALPPLPRTPKPSVGIPALGNPSLERAFHGLRKAYPAETQGISVVPDWSENMFGNTNGSVEFQDPTKIHVNALSAALNTQKGIDRTVAHEFEHTRQMKDPAQVAQMRRSGALPYADRPHENSARQFAQSYANVARPVGSHEGGSETGVAGRFNYDLGNMPGVQELLELINKR